MRIPILSFLLMTAFASLVMTLLAPPVSAQTIERIGNFQYWSAFKTQENGQAVCFMASKPIKDEGNYTRRGDIYTMVTHRPGEGRKDEVSVAAGYTFQSSSKVNLTIDGKGYTLYTQGESAWPADKDGDHKLVRAMIKGIEMMIKGTSSRGTLTTDTYSLKGFTNAYEAINKACNMAS